MMMLERLFAIEQLNCNFGIPFFSSNVSISLCTVLKKSINLLNTKLMDK